MSEVDGMAIGFPLARFKDQADRYYSAQGIRIEPGLSICVSVGTINGEGRYSEFDLYLTGSETMLDVGADKNPCGAIIDVTLNGVVVINDYDTYKAAPRQFVTINVPGISFRSGLNTVRVTVVGKNPSAKDWVAKVMWCAAH
ncbi:MAG: hypothetical protein WC683_07585 [bacterium]